MGKVHNAEGVMLSTLAVVRIGESQTHQRKKVHRNQNFKFKQLYKPECFEMAFLGVY